MATATRRGATRRSRKSSRATKRQQQDTPRERIGNLTKFWTVLGAHPLLVPEALEVREWVIDNIVGDLTIPEGSRWQRDTPLLIRLGDPARLRTAVSPELRRQCREELERSPDHPYLRNAGIYLTVRYPHLHECGLYLGISLLQRALCAVLRTGSWEAGLPVLVAQVAQEDQPLTRDELRAAAALWEARPVARASHRLLHLPYQETPALALYDIDPAQPNDADRLGSLIAIYPDRCRGSLAAAIKALRATWHASYLPVGARVNNRPIECEERMARYRTWWSWYQEQPEDKHGDDRLRAAVLAGRVGNVRDWPASRSGFLSGSEAARLWLHPVQSPLTAHEVIRHIS